jgi:hypothetical protein
MHWCNLLGSLCCWCGHCLQCFSPDLLPGIVQVSWRVIISVICGNNHVDCIPGSFTDIKFDVWQRLARQNVILGGVHSLSKLNHLIITILLE